jgi:hypothetical protein
MDFRGLGPHRHDELEDQSFRHRICRSGAYDRGRPPGDCLEVRISLPEARRDSSSSAGVIEYALSYGTFHLAELRMTSRVCKKTVALMIGSTYRRHVSLRHGRYQLSTSDQRHATYLVAKSFPPNRIMPHHRIAMYPFNTSRYTKQARHLVTDSDHTLTRYQIHAHLHEDRSHSGIYS